MSYCATRTACKFLSLKIIAQPQREKGYYVYCLCMRVCVLTWLLGRQSQLRVQVWTVVRIYPTFILLSPTTNPVQTDTCKKWQKKCINALCMTLAFFGLLNKKTRKISNLLLCKKYEKQSRNEGRDEKAWTGGRLRMRSGCEVVITELFLQCMHVCLLCMQALLCYCQAC